MRNFKKVICFLLTVVLFSGLSLNVSASEMTDADRYEAEGKDKIVFDNGDVAYYDLTEEVVTNSLLATSYKSKTVTGRFYLTSTGDTVAEYSLSATFEYDGETVDDGGHRVWIGNFETGWSGEAIDGYNWISPQYMYINGYFYLYKDGEYNNEHTLTLYCDQFGNITVG